MQPRKLAVLIIVGNLTFTSVSKAQMWGTGMWGGMQPCPYNYGAADGASELQDQIADLQEEIRELKHNKREDIRRQKQLEKEKEDLGADINGSFHSGWGGVVIDHMEGGYSCCNEPPSGGYGYPTSYPQPQQYQSPSQDYEEAPPPAAPTRPQPAPRKGNPLSDIFEPAKGGRHPASDSTAAGTVQDAEVETGGPVGGASGGSGGNPWDTDLPDGGGEMGGGGPNCAPPNQMNTSRRWKERYCRDGGEVSAGICRDRKLTSGEARHGGGKCERAVSRYRKVYSELMALNNKIDSYERQIADREAEIRDLRRDMREEARYDRLEGGCRDCERRSRRAERGPSLLSMAVPLVGGLLGAGLSMYAGYQANKQGNQINGRLGWPAAPYNAVGYGYPFVAAGIQGAVAAGTNGGFGCAGGMYGGGPFGPNGMGSPFGYGLGPYGMMNGPFGYPNMFGMNPMMGGGMYAPGMGPWGMSGPWGNGYNPMFGMQGGFGMPGMGIGGGIGMGMPGMGMPGMGLGMGGFPGMGMGMGMPGLGFGGGLGMGLGGMPYGAMGSMGYPIYPGGGLGVGIGGGFGMGMGTPYAGYGIGAGFGMPLGMGGYPGGYGMMPGGYGGMGMMGGYPGGMGMMGGPSMMAAMQNYRARMAMNAEFGSLLYRTQQLNNGMMGAGLGGYGGLYQPYTYGLGIGGGVGFGVGYGAGIGYGGGLGTYGSGFGLGAPGQTR